MREKKQQCVVTFHTTTQAMAFEKSAKRKALTGRLIPLPRVIGAGCGMAWREDPENRGMIEKLIQEEDLKYDTIYEVEI